ncbi:hypothetical protein DJ77_03975 [Halorubrum ezzemoulense]|nr:hypothetical protein DJ77_03975 [Halorubrum ezzemoulense]
MDEGTVTVPDEQYERLAASRPPPAAEPRDQLARLIDDAYAGLDADGDAPESLRSASATGSKTEE